MRKIYTLAIVAGLCATNCLGQLPSTPAPQPPKASVAGKAYVSVALASFAAAAADAHSTNVCLAQGRVEANPLLGSRPSRGQVWAFEVVMTGASTFVSWELRRHHYYKLALFVPALSAGEHTLAAVHNGCW